MRTYTLLQEANWTTWTEHPSGSRHPEIKSFEQKKLDEKFSAENIKAARREARRRLEQFATSLPKKHEGSISGTSAPSLTDPIFAQVQNL